MPRKSALAAAADNRLALLRGLRDELIASFEACDCVRDREPLARRIAALACEISELDVEGMESPADQIAARRAARKA